MRDHIAEEELKKPKTGVDVCCVGRLLGCRWELFLVHRNRGGRTVQGSAGGGMGRLTPAKEVGETPSSFREQLSNAVTIGRGGAADPRESGIAGRSVRGSNR